MTPDLGLGTPNEVTLKFQEILKSNGIQDKVSEVIVSHAGNHRDGLVSQTQNVTVKFSDPNVNQLNLFVKTHIPTVAHATMIQETKLFEKEATFFMEYLPVAKAFCNSKGRNDIVKTIYPKCYYADANITVLENLVLDKGYVLLKKEERQGLDATKLAITTLAKHHAIAHAVVSEYGGPEQFFKKFPNLIFESFYSNSEKAFISPLMDDIVKTSIKVLEKNDVPGSKDIINKLKNIIEKPFDMVLEDLKYNSSEDNFLVLNHGDYWNNNMMFLKDKTGNFSGHIALDFQLTRYNTPVLDLLYYMYTSVKPNIRRAHLPKLLHLYLETLKNITGSLGHPINLSYDDLLLMFRKKLRYGFWFGVTFCNDISSVALKDADLTKINDLSDWSSQVDGLIQKWIDENPEKCEQIASNLVKLFKEYYDLLI